ncbi:MAG TPA: glucan biosynthesis protein D, partial [Thiothrix sp.]|nr:glucan biosynthesis protein D [Thiothrix sp.]
MGLLSLINVINVANASSSCLAHVQEKAQALLKQPYQAIPDMGEEVRNLSYHDYQNIRFIAGKTLWRKEQLPFQMEFMHPGMQFNQAIKLHVWENKQSTPIPFSRKYFHYAGLDRYFDKSPLDYTGFRLLYPIDADKVHQEFLVFQGASYFRSRGRDETYGLSARAIALNTHSKTPEEFPTYTQFWIEKPQKGSKRLRICGLLDSPSLTGATEFIIEPNDTTTMLVETVIYPRKPLQEVGIAPLTSMFFHGENALSTYGDYRPEVHDSDGLLIKQDKQKWHWHPLREAEWVEVKVFDEG